LKDAKKISQIQIILQEVMIGESKEQILNMSHAVSTLLITMLEIWAFYHAYKD